MPSPELPILVLFDKENEIWVDVTQVAVVCPSVASKPDSQWTCLVLRSGRVQTVERPVAEVVARINTVVAT